MEMYNIYNWSSGNLDTYYQVLEKIEMDNIYNRSSGNLVIWTFTIFHVHKEWEYLQNL